MLSVSQRALAEGTDLLSVNSIYHSRDLARPALLALCTVVAKTWSGGVLSAGWGGLEPAQLLRFDAIFGQ